MKPLTEKFLASGMLDKATVRIMEQMGLLPEGSTDKTKEDALKDKTKAELVKLADDLMGEVEKANLIRETSLDLDRLRWPAEISVQSNTDEFVVTKVQSVMDRMGRYYFRTQDVEEAWFVPGYVLLRQMPNGSLKREMIVEAQTLYIDTTPVCVQVATK